MASCSRAESGSNMTDQAGTAGLRRKRITSKKKSGLSPSCCARQHYRTGTHLPIRVAYNDGFEFKIAQVGSLRINYQSFPHFVFVGCFSRQPLPLFSKPSKGPQ
jgi:hypothetical protein